MNQPDEMNPLDGKLAQLFAQDDPDAGSADSDAFVASVHERVARRRWGAKAAALCGVATVVVAAGTAVVLAPELVLYPARLMQGVLTSPLGATACALAAIGLGWWSRYGDA